MSHSLDQGLTLYYTLMRHIYLQYFNHSSNLFSALKVSNHNALILENARPKTRFTMTRNRWSYFHLYSKFWVNFWIYENF